MKIASKLILCFALLSPSNALADFIVAPNSNASVEGDTRLNTAPFNNPSRYQQVFSASQFGSSPVLITQLAFRPDGAQGAFLHFLSELRIDLSTTRVAPGSLSSTFASNVGANNVTVFDSPIILGSASIPGPGNTKAFDVVINLTTPFLYNPSSGNLLLDIRNFGSGFTGYVDGSFDQSTSIVFSDGSPTATTGLIQAGGAITRFTVVPEPSSLLLVGIASSIVMLSMARQNS